MQIRKIMCTTLNNLQSTNSTCNKVSAINFFNGRRGDIIFCRKQMCAGLAV